MDLNTFLSEEEEQRLRNANLKRPVVQAPLIRWVSRVEKVKVLMVVEVEIKSPPGRNGIPLSPLRRSRRRSIRQALLVGLVRSPTCTGLSHRILLPLIRTLLTADTPALQHRTHILPLYLLLPLAQALHQCLYILQLRSLRYHNHHNRTGPLNPHRDLLPQQTGAYWLSRRENLVMLDTPEGIACPGHELVIRSSR